METKPDFTIDEICAAFNSVELTPAEPNDDNEFAQFDDPDETRQSLDEYTEATIAIKYQPRIARKLVGAVNDYLNLLYSMNNNLQAFVVKPTELTIDSIGRITERLNASRRKIAKQYKRVGDFNTRQLNEIVAFLLIGLTTARNKA